MTQMDIEAIKQFLPHRYPFLLIDRVIEITDKSLTAIKNVTANELFFLGHFPSQSVMPGVLLIESLAQASGILIYKILNKLPEKELYYLAGVDKARFKRLVIPGDQLRINVEIEKHRLDLWKFKGTVSVDDEIACTAEFMNIKGGSFS